MRFSKRIIFFIAAVFSCLEGFSQYDLNSPYSEYGLGDIDKTGWGVNRALGGIGIGMRQPDQINYLNPASYCSQDTMSFIWDIGLFSKNMKSTVNGVGITSRNSMNFDHLAMSFPVYKTYFISMGLVPYSTIGYNLSAKQIGLYTGEIDYTYKGYGNINQLYFGHSVGLLKKHINLGVNANYYFGSLHKETSMGFSTTADGSNPATLVQESLVPKGFGFNFGGQFVIDLPFKSNLIIGATYDLKTNLKTQYTNYVIRSYSQNYEDTLILDNSTDNYAIPSKLGLGITYNIKDKILIGLDYTRQNWKNTSFAGSVDPSLRLDQRYSFGVQYVPEEYSYKSYFRKIRYRFGGYYNESNIQINGTDIKDMGLSAGFGLPFKNTHTMFNFAFEVGQKGTLANDLIKINYTRITFSVNFFDFWFVKRKYD